MLVLEENRSIEFREEGLLVKTLSDDQDLHASYHLRHQVFPNGFNGFRRTTTDLKLMHMMYLPRQLGSLTTTGSFVASFG